MTEPEIDAGALSSQGRFQRMEESLLRIEHKLDAKADSEDLRALESRVVQHGREIDGIKREGSDRGREALMIAEANQTRLTALESEAGAKKAVQEALLVSSETRRTDAEGRFRMLSAVLAFVMIVNLVLSTISALHLGAQ